MNRVSPWRLSRKPLSEFRGPFLFLPAPSATGNKKQTGEIGFRRE